MNVTTQGIGHKVMSVLMALVLAIGLAPMVPAGNAYANIVDTQTSWDNATVVVKDLDGTVLEANSQKAYELPYTGEAQYPVIESVTPEGATALTADDFEVSYKDSKGTDLEDLRQIKEEGSYTATIKVTKEGSKYAGMSKEIKFSIVKEHGDAVVYYDADGDKALDEGEDATITYFGEAVNADSIRVAIDGKDQAIKYKSFFDANGAKVDAGSIVNVGSYQVVVQGDDGSEIAGEKLTLDFAIEQLDLSTAAIVVKDIEATGATLGSENIDYSIVINGAQYDKNDAIAKDIVVSGAPMTKVGAYDATLSAATGQQNVTGNVKKSYSVVDDIVDVENTALYGEKTVVSMADDGCITFDASAKEVFDADLITVPGVEDEDVVVTVTDKDGNVVEPTAGGTYTLTISVVTDDFSQGGKAVFTMKVTNGDFENTTATITYKGEVVSAVSAVYDGTDVMKDVSITVKSGKTVLTEGVDYKVVLKKGTEEVDSAVDAGSYGLVIEGMTYDGTLETTVNIKEATITSVKVQGYAAGTEDIAYTGKTVIPTLLYTLAEDPTAEDAVWQVLPSEDYFLNDWTKDNKSIDADEVVETGNYAANITLYAKNYVLADAITGIDFNIVKTVTFADVSADAWYADEIAKAAANEYVEGMGNNLFFPEATMTRAQFAQVLFNMAAEKEDSSVTYPTQFTDVESSAWYAQAVSWAVEAGIVKGTSETTFDPEGSITREQIATMLYRYAGNGAEADLTALDSFVDGDQVSDWAANAMAWAVESGYMQGKGANDLQPQATATRAEVAALSVRVQPIKFE